MSINLKFPELSETTAPQLPNASLEALKELREEMCSQSISRDFKLQTHQRFLRRIMSPDSSTRSLLMVHGTGTGKTCSAIQIAEEFIMRPEFQDNRVLVLAQPAVQENFKNQIFDMSRVHVDADGLLLSKQCTGRRYLDIIQRIQQEPMKWSDKTIREKLGGIIENIISEFYEFQGYMGFANIVNKEEEKGKTHIESWIHKNFDNRMIIIDEAHSLRDTSEVGVTKLVSMALERVLKTATNITLILLTATPMFHSYDEILYYFDLFLWNERKQNPKESIQSSKIFTENGDFLPGAEEKFRSWCQEYISFIRGDNPLTFPFRLPPPLNLVAKADRTRDIKNRYIPPNEQRNVLTLTGSYVQGIQEEVLTKLTFNKGFISPESICVLPEHQEFNKTFDVVQELNEGKFAYSKGIPSFLSPSKVADYSSKFALITKIISESEGLIFVYSNLKEYGAQMFAMCLEEHGYESATNSRLLKNTSGEIERGSKGKYVLFTSDISDTELKRSLQRLKRPENSNGQDIKIIVASPKVSEGVDLRFVRQVHVLDYWYNMSRIEQVIGRGIRTCSHQLLPFEQQNCTVYLHVCRLKNSTRELIDEHIYRAYIEPTATKIAKVKQVIMESAIDCPLQQEVNQLPSEWKSLKIPQIRSQGQEPLILKLSEMATPLFSEDVGIQCKVHESVFDPDHERPLSSYTDVRDEIFDKLISLFYQKPVWLKADLLKTPELKQYSQEVIVYILQNAIETGLKLKNKNGIIGHLESKNKYYAFATGTQDSMQSRYLKKESPKVIKLTPIIKEKEKESKNESSVDSIRDTFSWISNSKEKFSKEVLDWYIVDHVLQPESRLKHMLSLDWDSPPIYAAPLKIDDILVLGSGQIYRNNEKITLIGDEADKYTEWISERKQKYIDTRTNFFATMKGQKILFNLDNKSDTLQVAQRSKTMGGMWCGSYNESLLNTFAVWLSGLPFPNTVKTKVERCQYLSLLIRDAIIKKKEGITWWTPEEWSIFMEDNKELRGSNIK